MCGYFTQDPLHRYGVISVIPFKARAVSTTRRCIVLTTLTGKRTHEACSPPPMERSLLWSIIARHMVLKFMTKNSHCWWTSQRKVRSEWEELQGHPAHSRAVGWVIGHATIWLARSNNFASRKAPESSLVLSDGFSIGFLAGLETKVCQTGLG